MAVQLEGGCRVAGMREGIPAHHGTLRTWTQIGRATGTRAISLRIIECAPGLSPAWSNQDCDEVLYIVEGRATIHLDGASRQVSPETGIYLPPLASIAVENPGPHGVLLASSRCPDPGGPADESIPGMAARVDAAARGAAGVVALSEREAVPTSDRWYRVLVDEKVGSARVTQFVGSIPPGRAPDHFHHYEEVLLVLAGSGVMWAGKSHTPIGSGSCIYLPHGQVHCVENTGNGELRLLGVFYPAGSPAVSYTAG